MRKANALIQRVKGDNQRGRFITTPNGFKINGRNVVVEYKNRSMSGKTIPSEELPHGEGFGQVAEVVGHGRRGA
jgi:hypothetical protein